MILGWSDRDQPHRGHLPLPSRQADGEGPRPPGERLRVHRAPAEAGDGVCQRVAAVPEPLGHGVRQHLWETGDRPGTVATSPHGRQVSLRV